jgi:CCR4-NOT transcriptional complex subunit CAF120
MNEDGGRSLQNVLSVSTAANNRYLFHFSSLNSLTQWTAAIRLSMFEHTTLQEAYTGSLIAGKGKTLNNIRQIMEKTGFKYEDWARVRFGAGTPWRRCYFVVTPPDEKEVHKAQKNMKKKPSYGKAPIFRGDLKFYETKRITKRTKPIATIKEAFSAYAIYPQSKPLIDQSTLVKIEGRITIHDKSESTTDGFVFVMPEVHPAVSGFEMMLRFLFPVWDTFVLYGRPNRLIADVRDQRGLMFALPRDRRYGYLELLDVAALIHTDGNATWTEREWRFRMKELTAKRMNIAMENQDSDSVSKQASSSRTSLPPTRNGRLRFDDSPSNRNSQNRTPEPRPRSSRDRFQGAFGLLQHRRSASDNLSNQRGSPNPPGGRITPASQYDESPPAPPPHQELLVQSDNHDKFETASEGSSKDSGERTPERAIPPDLRAMAEKSPPPQPVAAPPVMAHGPSQKPVPRPQMRLKNNQIDKATLSQLEDVSRNPVRYQSPPGQPPNMTNRDPRYNGAYGPYPDRNSWNQEEDHPTMMMHQHYQSPPPSKNRYQGPYGPSRLATIPASPYVDQSGPDSAKTPNSYFPHEETIHELPIRPELPHLNSSSSINRKPVAGSRPNTAPEEPDINQLALQDYPPSRKTPSPTKSRPGDRIMQTPPRMQSLGPAFDPRNQNPADGAFGPPLGISSASPEWQRPGYQGQQYPYDPNASPNQQSPGAPRAPNMSPQRQLQNQRTAPNMPENYYGGSPHRQSPGQMRPPGPPGPPGPGYRPPMQGPIPLRGGPAQDGPYPPPHMMQPNQQGPYDETMMPQNQTIPPNQQQQQQYANPRQHWV